MRVFHNQTILAAALLLCICAGSAFAQPQKPEGQERSKPDKTIIDNVSFPGLTLDADKLLVDVSAKVSLDEGLLEVIACTPDSREHESIVVIQATPMHIHAALLLLGAQNGNPAMMTPANEEKTEWVQLPPRGDPIGVSLVYKDAKGKTQERPISDFIKYEQEDVALDTGDEEPPNPAEVFKTFLFAGSQVVADKEGKNHYLADEQGNVVSISTFGDEVLCLPAIVTKDNHELAWHVDAEHLPKVGTEVKLRLTLQKPEPVPAPDPEGQPGCEERARDDQGDQDG